MESVRQKFIFFSGAVVGNSNKTHPAKSTAYKTKTVEGRGKNFSSSHRQKSRNAILREKKKMKKLTSSSNKKITHSMCNFIKFSYILQTSLQVKVFPHYFFHFRSLFRITLLCISCMCCVYTLYLGLFIAYSYLQLSARRSLCASSTCVRSSFFFFLKLM